MHGKSKSKAKPLRVSHTNPWDKKLIRLAKAGFTTAVQCADTGLTPAQVAYRRQAFKLRVRDYRNGMTPEAIALRNRLSAAIATCQQLRRQIGRM